MKFSAHAILLALALGSTGLFAGAAHAAEVNAAGVSDANSGDKVVCVREDVIGSLAQKRKVCHTKSEWALIRSNGQDEARRITQPGNMNCQNADPKGSGNLP